MAGALKHRGQLAVVASRSILRRAPVADRIAAIAEIGASAVSGRCAIAWDGAGAECAVVAPADDSRWTAAIDSALGALSNRLGDLRANGLKKAALTRREIDATMRSGKLKTPPAVATLALAEGGSFMRIVLAAGAESGQQRSSRELDALLELLLEAVRAEITFGDADKSAEFWRTYGEKHIHYCRIAQGELKRERVRARELEAAVAVARAAIDRDAAGRSGLLRQMALRMFTAVDAERSRIARDLHDDQAQLLAAAKIALEGGREEARAIFEQIECELRRKTRALRPATLGRGTLDEGIEREFRRAAGAGITAKLGHAGATDKISRPVQQLCFQVVREAMSNVIRHAGAKSVEVVVERNSSAARISISDDGCGIDAGKDRDGSGLDGVRERLELMGGWIKVESCVGRTAIVAEIPEP